MKDLTKKLKTLLKNEDVIDIIIFGSTAKGGVSPNDLDIALLAKNKSIQLKDEIKKLIPKTDVQILTLEDFHNILFLTMIKEGYSLKKEEYIHNLYKLSPVKLYKYSLKQLSLSKKVMFERGIKNIKGITKLSNSVVLVQTEKTREFEDFLKNWDMDIDTKDYELIPLMRKEEIF